MATVAGPLSREARGTTWLEDTTCHHRQALALQPRLMSSLTYTLDRQPVAGDLT